MWLNNQVKVRYCSQAVCIMALWPIINFLSHQSGFLNGNRPSDPSVPLQEGFTAGAAATNRNRRAAIGQQQQQQPCVCYLSSSVDSNTRPIVSTNVVVMSWLVSVQSKDRCNEGPGLSAKGEMHQFLTERHPGSNFQSFGAQLLWIVSSTDFCSPTQSLLWA